MLKISLLFTKNTNFTGEKLENSYDAKMRNFQGIVFV